MWGFEKVGVRPMRAAYRALVAATDSDAIVLVDGGTDILMRGDEAGLGTPAEDMTSLAAVARLAAAGAAASIPVIRPTAGSTAPATARRFSSARRTCLPR